MIDAAGLATKRENFDSFSEFSEKFPAGYSNTGKALFRTRKD